MKRAIVALLLILGACAAGLVCSELVYRWPAAREMIARSSGRGELLAIVDGAGLYDSDLTAEGDLAQLIIAANLRREARDEQISAAAIEREFELLQYQFGDPKAFESELDASRLTHDSLRLAIAEHLRARHWVEKRLTPLHVREEEARAFYKVKTAWFMQPPRFRVSHLFLAAPANTPPERILIKQEASKAVARRVAKGENFAQLILAGSEDEATRERGGDLGFFSAARMPPDFVAEVEKLKTAEPSGAVRSHLGFHILQLTDARPARQMPFEEVHAEIALHMVNTTREAAIERLRGRLLAVEFLRTPL